MFHTFEIFYIIYFDDAFGFICYGKWNDKNAVVAVVFLGGGIYLAVNKEKWRDF